MQQIHSTRPAIDAIQNAMMPNGGIPFVPPAYMQPSGDAAFQMNSGALGTAFKFTAPADFALSSLSAYVTAVAVEGNINCSLKSVVYTGYEPNGRYNGSTTNVAPINMVANNDPAPFVITAKNTDGTDAHGVSSAFSCFDGSTVETAGCAIIACKKLLIAGAVVDKGAGKVGIGCTTHGIATGAPIQFSGLANYAVVYTVDATSTANEIVVTAAYVAEVIDAADFVFFQPSATNPLYLVIDRGAGGGQRVNKYRITSRNNAGATLRGFPSSWTTYGVDDLTGLNVYSEAGWTLTGTETAQTDPGQARAKEYYATNATSYRYTMYKYTGVVAAATATPYLCILTIEEYAAQLAWTPGAEIYTIGTLGSGAAADAWVRKTFTAQQLQRYKEYCLTFLGTAAKDYSLSLRRWNTATGSMFPDGCETKTTADTGTTWTQAEQNSKPALMNIVLNSTANHCPPLMYGRTTGQYVYLSDVGIQTIPLVGISLACDDLTASTLTAPESATIYNVDLAVSGGNLVLTEYTADPILSSDGIEQETTGQRYVASMFVINRVSTKQGPVDVEDCSSLLWKGRVRTIGKRGPYAGQTIHALTSVDIPIKWNNNDDFDVVALCFSGSILTVQATIGYIAARIQTKTYINNKPLSNEFPGLDSLAATPVVNPAITYVLPSREVIRINQRYHLPSGTSSNVFHRQSTGYDSSISGVIRG